VLRGAQAALVPDAYWHESIDDLPERPLLLVANEFLDALPVRQHVAGVERRIHLVGGGLAFDRDGEIVEISPARDEAVKALSTKVVASGGTALIVDYGHERSAAGETLQAVRGHGFAPVLDGPGEQDLTAHVDFEAVANAARAAGAAVTPPATQGEWLAGLGIGRRAAALAAAHPQRADEFAAAVQRLTGRAAMGTLFKVIGIHAPGWPAPAGFA
jgi:SAM-dependent MidA family methyltransferase